MMPVATAVCSRPFGLPSNPHAEALRRGVVRERTGVTGQLVVGAVELDLENRSRSGGQNLVEVAGEVNPGYVPAFRSTDLTTVWPALHEPPMCARNLPAAGLGVQCLHASTDQCLALVALVALRTAATAAGR